MLQTTKATEKVVVKQIQEQEVQLILSHFLEIYKDASLTSDEGGN